MKKELINYSNVTFPEGCRGIIDVTKPPYNVDNTGKEDCTEKLCGIIDSLLRPIVDGMREEYEYLKNAPEGTHVGNGNNRKEKGRIWVLMPTEMKQLPTIYLPNGTYLVSDTVSYTLSELHNYMHHYTSGGFECNTSIRIIGQSREGTVIKLKDNCKGYEYGQERAVISFMRRGRSNVAMSNYLENLTVDVGVGNPGAVGVVFFANNSGAIRNVTVKSSDPDKSGASGILIKNELHSACNVYNTHVHGFSVGIDIRTFRTVAHFENIRLTDQTEYGIMAGNTSVQFIGVESRGNVPVLCMSENNSNCHAVLVNAELQSDGTDYAAVKKEVGGCLFMRNVRTRGFSCALEENWFERTLPDGYIKEYSSAGGYTVFDGHAESLGLPIRDVPDPSRIPTCDWRSVNEFGAVGDGVTDDTESIRAAFSSGASAIYFELGKYYVTEPIDIPATVEYIHFMFSDIVAGESLSNMTDDGIFRIKGESERCLLIEKLFAWERCTGEMRMFRHDGIREVFFRDVHTQTCAMYFNTVGGARVHFENCACTVGSKQKYGHIPAFSFKGQTVWCHAVNPERSMAETENVGGTLWWSGFKTEQEGSINVTSDGGVTEILGGIAAVGTASERPLILNNESTVSAVFATSGYHEYSSYPIAVKEIRNGKGGVIAAEKLPERLKPWYFMPLYSGRK